MPVGHGIVLHSCRVADCPEHMFPLFPAKNNLVRSWTPPLQVLVQSPHGSHPPHVQSTAFKELCYECYGTVLLNLMSFLPGQGLILQSCVDVNSPVQLLPPLEAS